MPGVLHAGPRAGIAPGERAVLGVQPHAPRSRTDASRSSSRAMSASRRRGRAARSGAAWSMGAGGGRLTDERLCEVCRRRLARAPAPIARPSLEQFVAAGPWQPPLDGRRAVMPEVPGARRVAAAGRAAAADRAVRGDRRRWIAWRWRGRMSRAPASRSVLELRELPGTYPSQRAVEIAIIAARRLTTTPEEERAEGRVGSRRVRIARAPQRWTSPHCTSAGCARRRRATRSSGSRSRRRRTAHRDLLWLGHLSDYLHAREDRGEEPERAHARGHDRLPVLAARRGCPTTNQRHSIVSATRRTVQFARRHLAGPGQPAEHGSAAGFSSTTRTCPSAHAARPRRARPGASRASCWRSCSTRRCSRRSATSYLEYRRRV